MTSKLLKGSDANIGLAKSTEKAQKLISDQVAGREDIYATILEGIQATFGDYKYLTQGLSGCLFEDPVFLINHEIPRSLQQDQLELDLSYFWRQIDKALQKNQITDSDLKGLVKLLSYCSSWPSRDYKTAAFSESEYADWERRVLDHSSKLAGLLEGSRLNGLTTNRILKLEKRIVDSIRGSQYSDIVKSDLEGMILEVLYETVYSEDGWDPFISTQLREIEDRSEKDLPNYFQSDLPQQKNLSALESINVADQARSKKYLIAVRLTAWFKNHTGQGKRRLVAIAIAALCNIPQPSEQQVRKWSMVNEPLTPTTP